MIHPKISLVTPSFNQDKYIEATICSILDQNYPNLEYIIIDGGSTDKSVEIIKKYERHLKYWVSEKDKGQSHAINKGLRQCTGDVFNWLNSDDYLAPNALKIIAENFQNPEIYLLAGKCRKFSSDNFERIVPENFVSQTKEEKILTPLYMQPSTFIRMNQIKQMGVVNEALHYCMDYEWILRFLLLFGEKNIMETNELLSCARLHNSSKTNLDIPKFRIETLQIYYQLALLMRSSNDDLKECRFDQIATDKSLKLDLKLNTEIQKDIIINQIKRFVKPYNSDISFLYRETAAYYHYFGQKKEALGACFNAIKANPSLFLNYKYFIKEILA